jgi:hypothetical protein
MSYSSGNDFYVQHRLFSSSPRTPLYSHSEHSPRNNSSPYAQRDFAVSAPSAQRDKEYLYPDPPSIRNPYQGRKIMFSSHIDFSPASGNVTTRKGVRKPQKCKRSRRVWNSCLGILPPGETNPHAIPGGKLCFEYMNTGKYIWNGIVT